MSISVGQYYDITENRLIISSATIIDTKDIFGIKIPYTANLLWFLLIFTQPQMFSRVCFCMKWWQIYDDR